MTAVSHDVRPLSVGGFFTKERLAPIVAGFFILATWEIVVRLFAPPFVATPLGILKVFPTVVSSAEFWRLTWSTVAAVFEGLAIASVLGTAIGVLVGRSRWAANLSSIIMAGLFAMPMVAILPLFSLWFGYSPSARLATIIFATIFSLIVNVGDGARAVPKEFIEVSRSYMGGSWTRLVDVILPASLPYILAGLRLAAGRALIGAVVAEYFTTVPGLGYFIMFQAHSFHHNEAFVAVAMLAASGVLFERLLQRATNRFLPWYRRGDKS